MSIYCVTFTTNILYICTATNEKGAIDRLRKFTRDTVPVSDIVSCKEISREDICDLHLFNTVVCDGVI